jgi:hypothetical protein
MTTLASSTHTKYGRSPTKTVRFLTSRSASAAILTSGSQVSIGGVSPHLGTRREPSEGYHKRDGVEGSHSREASPISAWSATWRPLCLPPSARNAVPEYPRGVSGSTRGRSNNATKASPDDRSKPAGCHHPVRLQGSTLAGSGTTLHHRGSRRCHRRRDGRSRASTMSRGRAGIRHPAPPVLPLDVLLAAIASERRSGSPSEDGGAVRTTPARVVNASSRFHRPRAGRR